MKDVCCGRTKAHGRRRTCHEVRTPDIVARPVSQSRQSYSSAKFSYTEDLSVRTLQVRRGWGAPRAGSKRRTWPGCCRRDSWQCARNKHLLDTLGIGVALAGHREHIPLVRHGGGVGIPTPPVDSVLRIKHQADPSFSAQAMTASPTSRPSWSPASVALRKWMPAQMREAAFSAARDWKNCSSRGKR